MFTRLSPYERYTPAQQELRAIAFSISSEKVPGASYVSGWHPHDPRPSGFAPRRSDYLTVDVIADLKAASYVSGWYPDDPRPSGFAPRRSDYLTVDVIADLKAATKHRWDPDASWTSVPSQRTLKRRERAANRRKTRDATSAWLGRGEESGSSLLVDAFSRRADWVLRKDGSSELVIR
jgi:hypothetical protein